MAKFVANGTTFAVGDGASAEQFTVLPGVVDFNGPQTSAPEVDATNLDSSAREFLPGLKDNGSIDVTLHLDTQNTQHQTLLNEVGQASSTKNYKLTFPNSNGNAVFAAWIQNAPVTGAVDQVVTVNASFRITGDVTWTYS